MNNPPAWLKWAREIQALGQTGLHYNPDDYNAERYRRLLAIAAEIVAGHTGLPRDALLENFSLQPGYATVKVDVRGAMVRDGRILLVQERSDGRWAMPGGWADVGEAPSAMVAREVREESGFEVEATKLVGVFDANRSEPLHFHHAYKLVFLCAITGGEARPSSETTAVEFFDFDRLPPLSSQRTDERHLAEVGAHLQDRRRPTAFE